MPRPRADRRTISHRATNWLIVLALPAGPLALAGCGATSAQRVVGASVARTEAAGSARFVLETSVASPVTTFVGTVDFTHKTLEMVEYGPSTPGKVTMEVREVGNMGYSLVPALSTPARGWVAQRLSRKLNALQFPLYAISSGGRASVVGHAEFRGTATTQYVVRMAGGSRYGARVAPYSLNLWVDGHGRIRRALQVETETGVKGHKGPVMFTSSVSFSDFGARVDVQAPRHYVFAPAAAKKPERS